MASTLPIAFSAVHFEDLFRYLTQFARHFRHQVFQTAHIAHLLDLFFKVIEIEAFAFCSFSPVWRRLIHQYLLNVFNQGQYVAHTEDAAGKTVGAERFEAVDFVADTR